MPVFLFNDIEGSTRLWEEYQDAMGGAISRHDAILQSLIGQHGGRILRHRGDGISAVFEDGRPLECAIAVQRQFALEDWGTVPALRIRLALHAGQAEREAAMETCFGRRQMHTFKKLPIISPSKNIAMPKNISMRCVPVCIIRDLGGAALLFRCLLYNPIRPRQNMLWALQHINGQKKAREFVPRHKCANECFYT